MKYEKISKMLTEPRNFKKQNEDNIEHFEVFWAVEVHAGKETTGL